MPDILMGLKNENTIEVVCLVHFREILENFNVKNFETILETFLENLKAN